MFRKLADYLILPRTCSNFERDYLIRMNRIASIFFALHLAIFTTIALLNGTGALTAAVLTTLTLVGPYLAYRTWHDQRGISIVMGITAMFMGGLLVHFGQGPVQIEMHFYFFVLIALLAVFANPMVILAAATTAAVHHAVLWLLLPASVFNYDAPIWVVAVHAAFVVLESAAACFIARSFFDNVIGLERKVEQRTREVNRRNADMRMILDSVEQGFFTIDRHGEMSEERSAAVETLLGPTDGRTSLIEILSQHDARSAAWLELGLDDVFAGLLPLELTLGQLPERIAIEGRTLRFTYRPVRDGAELARLAVVVGDISSEVEKERLEAEMREVMSLLDRIGSDKAGFLEFFQEAEAIVRSLRERDEQEIVTIKRQVHTLKGNAGLFGLTRVAEACHRIEDLIADRGELPDDAEWTRLFGCWSATKGNLRRITSDEESGIRLADEVYRDLLVGILSNQPKEQLGPRVAAWRLEPTARRLERIAEQARRLAERLGKGSLEVSIDHGGLRTDPGAWSDFWASLVHVVRNAVDHGFETSEERSAAGKPLRGRLSLSTRLEGNQFVIVVADDGRGIDFDRLAESARERGLPHADRRDLIDALFADGVSTSREVTEVSGRGIGMAAVRQSCEALAGTIEISTEPMVGTEFRFRFDAEAMAPRDSALLREHGVARPIWTDMLAGTSAD